MRLAACAVKAHALRLQQRLYSPPPAPGPSSPSLGEASIAVLYALRGAGATFEDCAQAAIPYELEVLKLPMLPSLDAIASASISLTAYAGLCAAVRALGGAEGAAGEEEEETEEGENGGGSSSGSSSGSGSGSGTTSGFDAAAAALTSGALTAPAPSINAALLPRAALTSPAALHTEYVALSELILSPYFPDPCGILEGSEEDSGKDCAAVLGLPTLFVYECVRRARARASAHWPFPPHSLTHAPHAHALHARLHPPPLQVHS